MITDRPADVPLLVLVSGPPGAGKSTLAQALSQRLGLMLISMDLLKAGIAFTMASEPGELRHWYAVGGATPSVAAIGGPAGLRSFPAADELIEVALHHGVSLVVEKAWQRRFDEARFRRFLPMAKVVQIHVTVNQEVARRRWAERAGRARGEEIDSKFAGGEFTWADFAPLELGVPLYVVDTTDPEPVDLARLESFIMKARLSARHSGNAMTSTTD